MKFKYEVGTRVCSRKEPDKKGTVDELLDDEELSDDELRVNWDDIGMSRWCEARDIMPDSPEAIAQVAENTRLTQAKIDEATSLLEQAFKAWSEAVSLQAGRDADSEEAYYLKSNDELDLSKFEKVVERNGWSTSSLYC